MNELIRFANQISYLLDDSSNEKASKYYSTNIRKTAYIALENAEVDCSCKNDGPNIWLWLQIGCMMIKLALRFIYRRNLLKIN